MLKYRADIDGLRAFSVLSVLIFHLEPSLLTGGFLGVDIFFVISGYLITHIILKEMRSSRFSLVEFYVRRIKRILPVFFLVSFIALVYAYVSFIPSDLLHFVRGLRHATGLIANVFFNKHGGYWSKEAELEPILHYWSLSVEEQFYLVFPVLLLLAYKYLKRDSFVILLTIVAFVSSVTISHHLAAQDFFASDAFYLLHSRAFELLSGVIVAMLGVKHDKPWLSSLSFLALVCFVAIYHEGLTLPGFTVLPVLIAAVGFLTYQGPKTLILKWLTTKPINYIGKISFSMYMYHWVLISFWKNNIGEIDVWAGLALTSLTITFASITYHFYEMPLRRLKVNKWVVFTFYLIIPIIVFVATCKHIEKNLGVSTYTSPEELAYLERVPLVSEEAPNYTSTINLSPFSNDGWGSEAHSDVALLIGDSHAHHYQALVAEMGRRFDFNMFKDTHWCPSFLFVDIYVAKVHRDICNQYNLDHLRAIQRIKPKYVFINNNWANYINTDPKGGTGGLLKKHDDDTINIEHSKMAFEYSITTFIEKLIEIDVTPVLMSDVPNMPMSPTHHNARRLRDGLETQKTIKIDPNDPRILYYREFFLTLQKNIKRSFS
ncbi:O-antigen acetylase [Vibrio maritimus]|uniref:O-antigen acetylase n=1 Tax=Vibrio maritimus TaxID=990268 RepID=A0A090S8V8_9VIBR|nr:O-antigen acetylase [Vibrio maritimus]